MITQQPEISLASKIGAWSSLTLLLYSFATIIIVLFIGPPPTSVLECFTMLNTNQVKGLLRLDVLTVFVMPLYFTLFYALYVVLKPLSATLTTLSLLFIVVGVTLFLSAPSVFSFVTLSDSYYLAKNETDKQIYLAAGEALFAADIWHGTGPRIGGILVQLGATVFSIIMIRSSFFSKATAYTGILTHGLDLLHMIIGFYSASAANSIMAVAGVLYLAWFPLIALSFFKIISTK